jgi:hypothetical protein
VKVLAIAWLLFVPPLFVALFGALLGIIPGLVLGIPGWHRPAGIILAVIFALGYIKQRGRNYGDVNWVTYLIAIAGGLGLAASIWFFGAITD